MRCAWIFLVKRARLRLFGDIAGGRAGGRASEELYFVGGPGKFASRRATARRLFTEDFPRVFQFNAVVKLFRLATLRYTLRKPYSIITDRNCCTRDTVAIIFP